MLGPNTHPLRLPGEKGPLTNINSINALWKHWVETLKNVELSNEEYDAQFEQVLEREAQLLGKRLLLQVEERMNHPAGWRPTNPEQKNTPHLPNWEELEISISTTNKSSNVYGGDLFAPTTSIHPVDSPM